MSAEKHTEGPWDCQFHQTATGKSFAVIVGGNSAGKFDIVICHAPDATDEPFSHAAFKRNGPLIAASPDMLAALQWCEQFELRAGEDANDRFERLADAFHKDTGYLRPGKSASMESGVTHDERLAAWDQWLADGRQRIRAALAKAIA